MQRHLVWLLAPALFCICALAGGSPRYRIVAYTTDWNAGEDAQLDKIDTLIFAFARISGDQAVFSSTAAEKLDRIVALKGRHPELKVLISIGGWGAGGFSEMAGTAAGRQAFADSVARMVATHHADGIDIDWEYPGHHESGIRSSPQDRANFTLLMTALRAALDRASTRDARGGADHYTLSAAVTDGPFASGVDVAAVAPLVDWFNLMTYDFCNSMTPDTCHHTGLHASALASADARTTDRAVRQFLSAGAPPEKLLIGVAMYAREFDQANPAHDGLYRPYGHYDGEHPWPQLKRDYIDRNGYVGHWDAQAQAPWLWNPHTHAFITYDDPHSIAAKSAYVESQHLGGIMYWEVQQDPSGELLDAIWRGLHDAQRN